MKAFDDAIADGVDIITVSLAGMQANPFDQDENAIGSFHAMSKGILVTFAGGNFGPSEGTVDNVAPWVITVAASSIDRQYISSVVLGDGTVLTVCHPYHSLRQILHCYHKYAISYFFTCMF